MNISELDFSSFPPAAQELAKTNRRARFQLRVIQYNRQMRTLIDSFNKQPNPRTLAQKVYSAIFKRKTSEQRTVRFKVPKRYRVGIAKAPIHLLPKVEDQMRKSGVTVSKPQDVPKHEQQDQRGVVGKVKGYWNQMKELFRSKPKTERSK